MFLRWRRVLARNTVVAHRNGVQDVEWSSSPWKARAKVAGFKMRFSSGRSAKIRYMTDDDALMLTHVVGRRRPGNNTVGTSPVGTSPVGRQDQNPTRLAPARAQR